MKLFFVSLALFFGVGRSFAAQELFYLGTYTGSSGSRGIYAGTLDSATGKLGALKLAATAPDPSFLALSPDGRALYAAEESAGAVEAWRRGGDGSLVRLNQQPANESGTCFVSVDPRGRDVLAANYGSGSYVCFRLEADGSLGPRTALLHFDGSGPDKDRQEASHAHSIYASPDGAFAYGCDLGADSIWIFKFDSTAGTLALSYPPAGQVAAGSGPRHLAFSRYGGRLYVANELGHSVTMFARDRRTGALVAEQTISTAAPGIAAAPAEIVLHPNGRWLYVSNRECDTISVFAVAASGELSLVQTAPAGVKGPRSIALDPTGGWLVAAGQEDNRLAVLRVDRATGELAPTGQAAWAPSPVCVLFSAARRGF
jgi:6-phosphogluconolactonase